MWASYTTAEPITLQWVSVGHSTGRIVIFYVENWSCGWLPFIYCGIVNWSHDMLYCLFLRFKVTGCLGGHLAIFHVYFGGHLAGCCACALPEGILHILPKLATMSALCSWYVHGPWPWVIWWLDRNRQDLLTGVIYIYIYIYISFCKINKVDNALRTCMSWLYFRLGGPC